MSYELRLFAPSLDEPPLVTARNRSDELPSSPPNPVIEAQKHRLAVALIRLNPRLKQSEFDHEELALFDRITLSEARLRYRHLELNGTPGGHGVQVAIFDDEVILSIPCWHRGPQAVAVFEEVWAHVQVLVRETGHVLYDPQMDLMVPFPEGHKTVLNHYRKVVEQLGYRQPDSEMSPAPSVTSVGR